MPNGFMKFTVNTVKCKDCGQTFNVNNYKNNMPVPRIIPASHIEHKCGGGKWKIRKQY